MQNRHLRILPLSSSFSFPPNNQQPPFPAMAPQPKKSKLTISSSSLASSSTSKPTKASKPARVVVEQEEEHEEEEKEERLSDLDNEDESMGEEGGDFSDEDDEGEMGDEFDLGGGQREGVEDYDTDDEIERVANDKQPEKSKKTASESLFFYSVACSKELAGACRGEAEGRI